MLQEYCPKCNSLQKTRESISSRIEKDKDGKIFSIETKNYHCEACNTFIKSVDKEIKN